MIMRQPRQGKGDPRKHKRRPGPQNSAYGRRLKAKSIEKITILAQKAMPTESLCDERAIFVDEKPRRGVAKPL
jgi:hypothetical protein